MHMRRSNAILTAGFALVLSGAAMAQNVVVVGDGTGGGAGPAARAQEAATARLLRAGIQVFDRAAVLGLSKDRASPKLVAELVSAARAVRQPALQAAVLVSVTPTLNRSTYVTRARVRVTVRLLDLRSGRRLAGAEGSSAAWRVPSGCERACLRAAIAHRAERVAGELTGRLLPALASLKVEQRRRAAATGKLAKAKPKPKPKPKPQPQAKVRSQEGFTVIFQGFSDADALAAEDYLAVFPGFRELKLTEAAEGRRQYRYRTAADATEMRDNLERMLDLMRLEGRVESNRGAFIVRHVARRAGAAAGGNDW